MRKRGVVGAVVLILGAGLVVNTCGGGSQSAAPTALSPTPSVILEATPTSSPGTVEPTPAPTEAASAPDDGTALAALALIPIKGRAAKTGYDRDQFGPTWADVDRNGCDTRNDILARDLTEITYKKNTRDCVVATGILADPYTAAEIHFKRGQGTSTKVQIDHVVALSDAWQKGAQQLDAETRREFANDPLNLLAVDGPANQSKGDGDAATWLPKNKAFRCQYVARQVAVKTKYQLWMTRAEHDATARILGTCPNEKLPSGGVASS